VGVTLLRAGPSRLSPPGDAEPRPRAQARKALGVLAALTALAAALRLPTLDRQSLWSDEAVTVLLTRMDLSTMLSTVAETESTPPVYYVVAWVWTQAFGHGEVGLRSLSALAGIATVPVAYCAGASLLTRRAGLAAAGLVAVSPLLVWYSQEARSYALAVLLCGLSFLACARALERASPARLAVWTVASVIAIGTHYFAGFVVAAEACWLIASRRTPAVHRAAAVVAVGAAALLPLALVQRGNAVYVGDVTSLAERVAVVAKHLLAGYELPADRLVAAVVALVLLASVVLVGVRASRSQQRGVFLAATVGLSAVVVPVVLASMGLDYFNSRNALVGLVPLAIAASAGLAVAAPPRLGSVVLVGVAGVLLTSTLAVAADRSYHRPDWRGLAHELDDGAGARVVVVAPDHLGWFGRVPLQIYLPGATAVDARLAPAPPQFRGISRRPEDNSTPDELAVREVVVAAVGWDDPVLPRPLPRELELVEERTAAGYRFRRYRSERAVEIPTAALAAPSSAVLIQNIALRP